MNHLKKDFPIFQNKKNQPWIYLDNAATTHKPQLVIDAVTSFYTTYNANVGRGIYTSAEQATQAYEHARKVVAEYIGACPEEIIFTSGATAGINTVAWSWALQYLKEGDEIVLTEMEHHSNLVPWQQIARKTGAVLRFIPVNNDGTLDLSILSDIINKKTKFVSCVYVSHALGTVNDIHGIIRAAKAVDAKVLIDAAQAAPHKKIDVKEMEADFLVFSGHKMLGPTGVGVLYIKKNLHDFIQPCFTGGGMVLTADWHHAQFKRIPHAFESGTPAIAQAIGLSAAIGYIQKSINFDVLRRYEASLCARLIEGLSAIPHITLLGPLEQLKQQGHIVSFVVRDIHAHDVAAYLNHYGICARAGHHCAQPLHNKLGITASVRVSFYFYNTIQEVDYTIQVMRQLIKQCC